MIAFDPETDFVVQPWLKNQNAVRLEKGQVLVGSSVVAEPGETLQFYSTDFRWQESWNGREWDMTALFS